MDKLSDNFWSMEENISQTAAQGWQIAQDGWEATKSGAESSKTGLVSGLQGAIPGLGLKHGRIWKQKFQDGTLNPTGVSKYANLGMGIGQVAGFAGAALTGVSLAFGSPGAAAAFGKASLLGFGFAGASGFVLGTQFSDHRSSEKAPNGGELVTFAEVTKGASIGAAAAALPVVGLLGASAMFDTGAPFMGAGVVLGQLAVLGALVTGSSLSTAGITALGLGALGGAIDRVVMYDQ